jgi:hypothetical protein
MQGLSRQCLVGPLDEAVDGVMDGGGEVSTRVRVALYGERWAA